MSGSAHVRDLIPAGRISEARIRELLRSDPELDHWSRSAPGASRPGRLAALIRDRVREGHNVSLAAVRERLATSGSGRIAYSMIVEVDVGGRCLTMVSRTCFAMTPRRSICADIQLTVGARTRSITGGPIVLKSVRA